jgi:hypothetical protein
VSEPDLASVVVAVLTGAAAGAVVGSGTDAPLLDQVLGGFVAGCFGAAGVYGFFVRLGQTTTRLNRRAEREAALHAAPPDATDKSARGAGVG